MRAAGCMGDMDKIKQHAEQIAAVLN
jgi:hypothetical protein